MRLEMNMKRILVWMAAALAAKAGCTPRELDVKTLQKTLKEQGACLA